MSISLQNIIYINSVARQTMVHKQMQFSAKLLRTKVGIGKGICVVS